MVAGVLRTVGHHPTVCAPGACAALWCCLAPPSVHLPPPSVVPLELLTLPFVLLHQCTAIGPGHPGYTLVIRPALLISSCCNVSFVIIRWQCSVVQASAVHFTQHSGQAGGVRVCIKGACACKGVPTSLRSTPVGMPPLQLSGVGIVSSGPAMLRAVFVASSCCCPVQLSCA